MRKDFNPEKTVILGSSSDPGLGSGLLCDLIHFRSILDLNCKVSSPKELELWLFFIEMIQFMLVVSFHIGELGVCEEKVWSHQVESH